MAVVTLPELSKHGGALRRPGRRVRVLPLAAFGTVLALLAADFSGPGAAAPASAPAPRMVPHQWVDIVNPQPLFALATPEFGQEPSVYAAQRQVFGGGRRDLLIFGKFDGGSGPYLLLSLYRIGSEPAPSADFFVTSARAAAEATLAVTRSEPPTLLATRFGNFEVADVILARGTAQAACLGFRLHAERPGFEAVGFACGGPGERPARALLACTLDRLSLVSPGTDHDLDQFFATPGPELELSCGDRVSPMQPTPPGARKAKRVLKSTDRTKRASS